MTSCVYIAGSGDIREEWKEKMDEGRKNRARGKKTENEGMWKTDIWKSKQSHVRE